MTQILGPFNQDDWNFLVYLKRSINSYPKDEVYASAVRKERNIYNKTLAKYKVAA